MNRLFTSNSGESLFVVTRFSGFRSGDESPQVGKTGRSRSLPDRYKQHSLGSAITFEYRRMTEEERVAIVEYRRSRGFPLHKPPHLARGEGWYLITAATYEHRLLFNAPNELQGLETRFLEAFVSINIPCAGWVVLPNHYHALLYTDDLTRLGKVIGSVHGRSSRYANLRDRTPGRQVWYKFNDRKMRSERHFWATLHYIIFNPVKHGYVGDVEQWPWSCVHELVQENNQDWLRDLIEGYPLGDYGDTWDEYPCS